MNVAQIIQQARDRTGITNQEFSDANALRELNFSYYKIRQEILLVDRNYGMDERQINLTGGVSRYPLLLPTGATAGQIKIDQVLLRYSITSGYHTPAQEIDWNNINTDDKRLENIASPTRPYYIIDNNDIVIFPMPKVSVGNGLRLRAGKRAFDLTLASPESHILLEKEYHDILTHMLVISLYRQAKQIDLLQFAQAEYDRKKVEMMRNLKKRSTRPMQGLQTDLSGYIRG